MRTLRLPLLGTVTLMLVGGLASVVLALDDAETAQTAAHEAAVFDGAMRYPSKYLTGTSEALPEGKLEKRGDGWEFRGVDLSDPRLSGTWRTIINEDHYATASGVWTTARRIDNAEGSWLGHFVGYRDAHSRWHHQGMLTGTGAYEGLTAIVFMQDMGTAKGYDVHGVIFPGAMPEAPEYPEPAA